MTRLPPLALSSMWFQRWDDPGDLRPFFAAGARMGFTCFELSHDVTPAALATVDPRSHRIAAVHHPCPAAPEAEPLTAADAGGRRRAGRALCATVETAARLGARAVVVHAGPVGHAGSTAAGHRAHLRKLAFEVDSRYRAGQAASAAYGAALARLDAALAAAEPAAVDAIVEAVAPAVARAGALGIRIGLETGYHPTDAPGPAGMRAVLDAVAEPGLGAWLDTGHVGAQVNLGRVAFDDWFAAVGDRWVGVHFHDVAGLRDHLAAGMGTLDFAAIGTRLPVDAVRTCEFDWYLTPDEVVRGADHLRAAACGA